jgi:hypothetical protein
LVVINKNKKKEKNEDEPPIDNEKKG